MFEKLALAGAASLLALSGFAADLFGGSAFSEAPEGRTYHYVRSNADGSSPEHVYVHRAADNRIEIYRAERRCTDAAFVTAWVNPETGRASVISGGRLMPGARHENFATLTYDGTSHMLRAEAALADGEVAGRTRVEEENWHLYDADLATLSVQTMALADPRAGFSFGLPMLRTDRAGGEVVSDLGRADARFVRMETYRGAPALRFEVGGPALGDNGGPLWLDASSGHVLGASWGVPNQAGMDDFSLRLVGVDDGGEAGWRALLTRHYEGCART